jgi:hypothetical protein
MIAMVFVNFLNCNVARMGKKRTAFRLLVGEPAGKRQLERPRRR